jgi:hypothetical protein
MAQITVRFCHRGHILRGGRPVTRKSQLPWRNHRRSCMAGRCPIRRLSGARTQVEIPNSGNIQGPGPAGRGLRLIYVAQKAVSRPSAAEDPTGLGPSAGSRSRRRRSDRPGPGPTSRHANDDGNRHATRPRRMSEQAPPFRAQQRRPRREKAYETWYCLLTSEFTCASPPVRRVGWPAGSADHQYKYQTGMNLP